MAPSPTRICPLSSSTPTTTTTTTTTGDATVAAIHGDTREENNNNNQGVNDDDDDDDDDNFTFRSGSTTVRVSHVRRGRPRQAVTTSPLPLAMSTMNTVDEVVVPDTFAFSFLSFFSKVLDYTSESVHDRIFDIIQQLDDASVFRNNEQRPTLIGQIIELIRGNRNNERIEYPFRFVTRMIKPENIAKRIFLLGRKQAQWNYLVDKLEEYWNRATWLQVHGNSGALSMDKRLKIYLELSNQQNQPPVDSRPHPIVESLASSHIRSQQQYETAAEAMGNRLPPAVLGKSPSL